MKQLFRSMREVSFEALTREVSVGVLLPAEYAALASVTSAVEPLTPLMFELFGFTQRDLAKEDSFGLRSVVQREGPRLVEAWRAALQNHSLAYSLIEGNQVPGHQKYKVLFVPTLDFLDEALAAKLLAYAEAGGVVVIGPQLPDLDPKFLPSVAFAELGVQIAHERHASDKDHCTVPFGAGAFWFIEQRGFDSSERLSEIIHELAMVYQLGSRLTVHNAEWTLYRDEAGAARVVFLASAREHDRTAALSGEPFASLTDALTGELFLPIDGAFQVKIPAWTVRMLIAKTQQEVV